MNSIYDIYESILDDIETTMDNGVNDVIIDMIFDKDINKRRQGFEQLRLLVESYHPKSYNTTAKMKNSDSYFIEFTWPIKIEDGELTNQILDYISYTQICKRIEYYYRIVRINSTDTKVVDSIYELNWRYAQRNFHPKTENTKLYEVPKELNGLFEKIYKMKTYKHN